MFGIMLIALGVFVWTVVLPIASLIARGKAKAQLREAEDRLAQRDGKLWALAKAWRSTEWTGRWRSLAPRIPGIPSAPEAVAPAAPEQPVIETTPVPVPVSVSVSIAAPLSIPLTESAPAPPPPLVLAPAPALRDSAAEVREAVEQYSAWREQVRPFLIENIGWFIGGFLVVAGSLYFLHSAWDQLAQLGRVLLIVATALAYSGAFVGFALWLKRAHGLATASRAMACVGLALLPVAALSCSGTFALRPLAWALATPMMLAAAWPLLYLASGLLDRGLARPLSRAMVALLAAVAIAPPIASASPQATLLLPYAAWAIVHAAATAPLSGTSAPSAGALGFHLSALAYGLLFVIGRAHALGGDALPFPAFYGPLAVLIAFSVMRLDIELRARWGSPPEIDAAVVACFAVALAGVALAARQPVYLALSAGLAAALFAAALAWYRRALLVYFSLTAAAGSLLALARGWPPVVAPLLLLAQAEGASQLGVRFTARSDEQLGRAARRSRWLLLFGGLAIAAPLAFGTKPLGSAPTLIAATLLLALWHSRSPSQRTAWLGATWFGAAATVIALHFSLLLGAALAAAAIALSLAAVPALLRTGERRGASALVQVALLAALLATGVDRGQLAVLAIVAAASALALGSALPGFIASLAGAWFLMQELGGLDGALAGSAAPRWALVPAAGLVAAFALRQLDRFGPRRTLRSLFPLPAPGFAALSGPLLYCAGSATLLLAIRAAVSIDSGGAQTLAAVAACSIALAWLSEAPLWSAVAAFAAALAGAWASPDRLAAHALGGAVAAAGAAGIARVLGGRVGRHATAAIDAVALALVAATLAGCTAGALSFRGDPAELRVAAFALAVCAAALGGLVAPVQSQATWPALVALSGAAALAPIGFGMSPPWAGCGLAALAVALVWTRALLRTPSEPLRAGPTLIAAAALAWNVAAPGEFLDRSRAICDALLLAYLGSELATQGGVGFLHVLLALAALAAVRARTILGIVPSGWGTIVAGAALLGLGITLRRRDKYARALWLWSSLALGYACARSVGTSFVLNDRWSQMAVAALVAVPLGAWFAAPVVSAAAVAAVSVALLGAVAALAPALWTSATWPLAPALLALVHALVAEPLTHIEEASWCAPKPLRASLRVAAIILGLLPASLAALPVALAALRIGASSGPGALAAVPIVAGAVACMIAVRRGSGSELASRYLGATAACLAVLAVALPVLTRVVPSGAVLVLLAQSLVVSFAARRYGELRPVSLALWVLGLTATHAAPGEWTTAAALAVGVWFARRLRLPGELSAPTFIGLGAAGFALAFADSHVPLLHGAGIAAPLALLASAAMLFHELRSRASNATALALGVAATLGLAGISGPTEAQAVWLFGAGGALLALSALRARTDGRYVYAGAAVAISGWVWARARLGIAPSLGGELDGALALAATFLLTIAQAALPRISAQLTNVAAALPVALPFVAPHAAAAGVAAALYALLAWLRRSRLFAHVAVVLVNVALFAWWRQNRLEDVQLYTLPLGLSLLAAAHISHRDLSRQQLSWLRGLGCLVLYAGTAMQMFRFEGPTYPLVLGGLAIATVTAGVALQIRAFAFFGTATLVADLLANLVRASAHSSRVLAVSATLTGFAILGAMIWLSVKRAETLALYRRLSRAMDDWE
jgi:hypothetical protein